MADFLGWVFAVIAFAAIGILISRTMVPRPVNHLGADPVVITPEGNVPYSETLQLP